MNKKRKVVILLALAFVLVFALSACDPGATLLSALTLNENAVTLEVGETFTISVTTDGEMETGKTINWLSSNEEVVTVEPNSTGLSCLITAVAKGTATITVSYGEEIEVTAAITVNDTAGDLVVAKSAKKAALDNLVLDYTEADFSPANWTTLMGYISAAKTAVDNSTTIAAIAEIVVADVKVDCDAVLTEAEEEAQALAAAKVAKKAELDNLAQDYSEEDYSPATW
ncbi:MAG TPA: Ig-like domain-containing protein, partial [Clostridia bacterium]|nr:Ig-like domain-containing protein [Clostridia bacterium]